MWKAVAVIYVLKFNCPYSFQKSLQDGNTALQCLQMPLASDFKDNTPFVFYLSVK